MDYALLSKLYYSDKVRYEETYQARFRSDFAVHLDFSIGEHEAFFVETPTIRNMLTKVLRIDKQIALLEECLPDMAIQQFVRRCLIDEVVLTNNIEGVHSTRREIDEILTKLDTPKQHTRFMGLVRKYRMLSTNSELVLEQPKDLRELYDELVLPEVVAVNKENAPDGALFRRSSVSIFSPSQKEIHRGLLPESSIINGIEKAIHFSKNGDCDALYRIGIFHYLLEYIHPFYDGNGRLGRYLVSAMLAEELQPIIGYRISYTVDQKKKEYYHAFATCNDWRSRGDLTPFLAMFMDILLSSVQNLHTALWERTIELNRHFEILSTLDFSPDCGRLLGLLIQVALFSEDGGASTALLLEHLQMSRGKFNSLLTQLPEGLATKRKVGNENRYRLDLMEFGKL